MINFREANYKMSINTIHPQNNILNVEVVKSNCFGNNFVIYDAIDMATLEEVDLPAFSRQVTDPQFGIGADNFLVIQNCNKDQLLAINEVHDYWEKIPTRSADYVFRMFEPDGQEALCCGNGLMCIANYLFEKHKVETAHIMTEVPLTTVNVTTIGVAQNGAYGWVNLGAPRKTPDDIRTEHPSDNYIGEIQIINELRIKFRKHDLEPYITGTELILSGHLIFTGEPHLVFLLDEDNSPIAGLSDVIFAKSEGNRGAGPIFQRRHEFGTWLVNHIGQFLNTHYRDRFPIGINVNFVKKNRNSDSIEYRCYERGIDKETLACGTGAVGVAYVVNRIRESEGNRTEVLPHRCRWFKPHALISVTGSENGWTLQGQPSLVAEIGFRFESPPAKSDHIPRQHAG